MDSITQCHAALALAELSLVKAAAEKSAPAHPNATDTIADVVREAPGLAEKLKKAPQLQEDFKVKTPKGPIPRG